MAEISRFAPVVLAVGACAGALLGQPEEEAPAVPALVTSPMPFIGITPCRIVDTRDANRPPGYGPPALSAGVPRNFTLAGQCGIPPGAQAASLNVTVVSPQGLGYVLLYPQGGSQPGVSTLNYVQGLTVANAAIVPLGTGGGVTVAAAVSGTDFLIDVNGYYGASPTSYFSAFVGGGNAAATDDYNTGVGAAALASISTGSSNTAFGWHALLNNTTGSENTAAGNDSLSSNADGSDNTALGHALRFSTNGSYNTAVGSLALANTVSTSFNTAVGPGALENVTTGNNNTGFPGGSGQNLTTGSNNIYLNSFTSPATESATTRIGDPGFGPGTWMSGIYGSQLLADALPVFVDPNGQFGTVVSSRRFKQDVRGLAEASTPVSKLRPVTFRYRPPAAGGTHFGLIAEEVETIMPELVIHDAGGAPVSVRYDELPVLLLQEIQKQQAQIEAQKAESSTLEARAERAAAREQNDRRRIEALRARLSALEAGTAGVPPLQEGVDR